MQHAMPRDARSHTITPTRTPTCPAAASPITSCASRPQHLHALDALLPNAHTAASAVFTARAHAARWRERRQGQHTQRCKITRCRRRRCSCLLFPMYVFPVASSSLRLQHPQDLLIPAAGAVRHAPHSPHPPVAPLERVREFTKMQIEVQEFA